MPDVSRRIARIVSAESVWRAKISPKSRLASCSGSRLSCCCCCKDGPLPPLFGVLTPRGFLLYDRRMPPFLTRPLRLSPYNSFSAFVAYSTVSNYNDVSIPPSQMDCIERTSMKHIGPLLFCRKQSLR